MACTKEINADNLLEVCLADSDELIIVRTESVGPVDTKNIFRTTYGQFKSCLIAPASLHFFVDDPENEDVPDELTYPLGGGTILFYSKLIGRNAAIIHVNGTPLPQKAGFQPDYCTINFTSGEITRPDTFKAGDFVEVFPL